MSKQWFLTISFILLIGAASVVYAEPFAVQATNDLHIGNDPQLGPADRENADGLHIRNIATRRRVAYVRYDISSLKESGKVFFNTFLNIRGGPKDRTGPVSVWGIKEELDHTIDPNTICWNNAPGVMNSPMPPLDMPVELDYADLSPVLIALFNGIVNDTRVSTPSSQALAEFLNEDTDGIIVLMIAETGFETASAIIRPINYTTAGTGYGTPELFGIVLAGEKDAPRWPSDPNPANNSTAPISTSLLSWTKPEPNLPGGTVTCDVYFHTNVRSEPNSLDDPNYILPDYGYTTLATGITNNFVALPTPPLPLVRGKTYRWIVDVHDTGRKPEKTQGFLWNFNTNNVAPSVDAGDNRYVWLNNNGDPASATATLNGTVTDDGYPNPSTTVLWTQDSGPAVAIDPNNVKDITLVFPQAETYRFRLTANDGALSSSDVVQVYVGATACDAAKAVPGYTPFDGDFNGDCTVSMSDFVVLAQHWLECNSLTPCN